MKVVWLAAAAALASGAARAEVTDRSPAGFEVKRQADIAAPPARVWTALMAPANWWNRQHTWSGDAANLSIDASGCFCERLPKGSVRHMTVVYSDGAANLRMAGALGPLQMTGASGHLQVALKADGATTHVTWTYDVGGYAKGGLAETFAGPVDFVLGEQLGRLKKRVETGSPD